MKNKSLLQLPVYFVICIVFISCVSKKKYLASQDMVNQLQSENATTKTQLNECFAQVKILETDKSALKSMNEATQNELMSLSSKTKMTIAEQAKRLKNLQDLIQTQRDIMNNLKKTIADALVNFKADELSVYIKDGNVYVSLEEKLLFKSGSAVVDPKGKEALKKLAQVLTTTKDINVLIEGHTDNVPIKGGKFQDNWALSAERSLSIVRLLTKEYGFDPTRITASGKSEYHPIAANSTAESRASNRRTEIILSPNLTELYNLIEQ